MRAVDLFAGWGGTTLGAERAGIRVVWAANHKPLAVRAHRLNHPATEHSCQDLTQANWAELPDYDLLLASPECPADSQAAQPARKANPKIRQRHDDSRATAWAIVSCADATEPQKFFIENVLDFRRWRLYPQWRAALEALGYRLQELVLTASEHGVPQRRKRLFILGELGAWPRVRLPKQREVPFGPCVQWDEGDWRPLCEASPGAQRRIRRARARCGSQFLTQHVTNHPGVPLTEPMRTITTKDQWAVVNGNTYRPFTIREYARGMGFPDHYTWPDDVNRKKVIKGLGNAVPPPLAHQILERFAA
jgi:DNA (cytosine-5)-methyltransferase 1